MADVAIVIGHHPQAQGAELQVGDRTVTEFDLWTPFAHQLHVTLGARGVSSEVIQRPNPEPDAELAQKVNATQADAAIELHFNAHSGGAHGSEMLHFKGSEEGARLATLLQMDTLGALDTLDRGVKAKTGFPFLRLTEMPAVICEPAFGSNERDAWRLLTRQCDLLCAYRSALVDFLQEEVAA